MGIGLDTLGGCKTEGGGSLLAAGDQWTAGVNSGGVVKQLVLEEEGLLVLEGPLQLVFEEGSLILSVSPGPLVLERPLQLVLVLEEGGTDTAGACPLDCSCLACCCQRRAAAGAVETSRSFAPCVRRSRERVCVCCVC